jgi:6-phospho-beta-glucosidase
VKLAVLGGGGFRVPLVYAALLRDTSTPRVDSVAVYDRSPDRLGVVATVLDQLAAETTAGGSTAAEPPRVQVTTDLDHALGGADFVFAAIRVGGLEGRVRDERVAMDLGLLGQETTGPGGIAYGLRTIPAMLRIGERIRAVAPQAYVINFTNPAGMVTEALQGILGRRVLGICDTPIGLVERAAVALSVDPARVQPDYVGLNHLGWLRRLVVEGRDRLPDLLADDKAMATLEETSIFGAEWLRTVGVIPNEYLYYFHFHREAVRSLAGRAETRGEFLLRQQADFYAAARRDPDEALALWRRTLTERSALYMAEAKVQPGKTADLAPNNDSNHWPEPTDKPEVRTAAGYEGVALAVMAAIARDERSTLILDVRNGGAIDGLDADAVVEVPCLVDANGAHPLATSKPDLDQLGLMQQVKAVERFAIEAATTGSAAAALKAFALHPLVDSVAVARDLLRGYAEAFPELAYLDPPD